VKLTVGVVVSADLSATEWTVRVKVSESVPPSGSSTCTVMVAVPWRFALGTSVSVRALLVPVIVRPAVSISAVLLDSAQTSRSARSVSASLTVKETASAPSSFMLLFGRSAITGRYGAKTRSRESVCENVPTVATIWSVAAPDLLAFGATVNVTRVRAALYAGVTSCTRAPPLVNDVAKAMFVGVKS